MSGNELIYMLAFLPQDN